MLLHFSHITGADEHSFILLGNPVVLLLGMVSPLAGVPHPESLSCR